MLSLSFRVAAIYAVLPLRFTHRLPARWLMSRKIVTFNKYHADRYGFSGPRGCVWCTYRTRWNQSQFRVCRELDSNILLGTRETFPDKNVNSAWNRTNRFKWILFCLICAFIHTRICIFPFFSPSFFFLFFFFRKWIYFYRLRPVCFSVNGFRIVAFKYFKSRYANSGSIQFVPPLFASFLRPSVPYLTLRLETIFHIHIVFPNATKTFKFLIDEYRNSSMPIYDAKFETISS